MKERICDVVFLVATYEAEDYNSDFIKFLKDEGFTDYTRKGIFPHCPRIYVDINHKYYAFALPGIKITGVIGNHAIRLNEFYTIYDIYKQYENKSIFVFKSKRFDFDE